VAAMLAPHIFTESYFPLWHAEQGSARLNYERKMAQQFAEDIKRAEYESKLHRDKLFEGR
jgi:hypothetical protein